LQNIFKNEKYCAIFFQFFSEIRRNRHQTPHKNYPYGEKRPKIIPISGGFLADLTNSAWRILADFHIRSGGFEIFYLATL
jgi:hypothetical protein